MYAYRLSTLFHSLLALVDRPLSGNGLVRTTALALALTSSLAASAFGAQAAPGTAIEAISPAQAVPGELVTITGRGFGAWNASVAVGGVPAEVVAATGRAVTFRVPLGLPPGPTTVTATNPGGHVGAIGFEVAPSVPDTSPPSIELETPAEIVVGTSPLGISGRATDGQGPVRVVVGSMAAEVAADGTFATDVDLFEGLNVIPVVTIDGSGNRAAASISATLDTMAPALAVDDPAQGFLNTRTVRVSGTATDLLTDVEVTVQGLSVAVGEDGSFTSDMALPEGPGSIVVVATDQARNKSTVIRLVTVFISPEATFMTPGGATLFLLEGALTRPDQTVEVRDLTSENLKRSFGPDGGEIVPEVPPGGLTDDIMVMPGAVAMTFDGTELPDPPVNGTPSPRVPAMGGLTNDIPLWILQLVPDRDGDGLPELRLASQARISDDGTTLEPVDPPPGSPYPGFSFAAEHGFDATTIGQVDGLDHASLTYVAGCSGWAAVAVKGDTNCNPGPTAKNVCEEADRIRTGLEAERRQLQRLEAERQDVLLNEILGPDGSLVPVLAMIAALGVAGEAAALAQAELSGATLAELAQIADDVLGPTPPGTGVGLAWLLAQALYETVKETIDAFNEDLSRYLDLTQEIEQLQEQIERDAITYQGLKMAAHEFSGCTDPLVEAAEAAGKVAARIGALADANAAVLGSGGAAWTELALLEGLVDGADTALDALLPLLTAFAMGGGTEMDAADLRAGFDAFALANAIAEAGGDAAGVELQAFVGLVGLAPGDTQDAAAIGELFDAHDAIPPSGGIPKAIQVSIEGLGQHHTTVSGPDGKFLTAVHTALVFDPTRRLEGRAVTARGTIPPALEGVAMTSFDDVEFPGAGLYDISVADVGSIVVGFPPEQLLDRDGDEIGDGEEETGGSDPDLADTDFDGFPDLTELLATSDPTDAASVPPDDLDRDGIPDGDEPGLGTDPLRSDTDRDFLRDGAEVVLHGTDPLLADTDADGFTDWAELVFDGDPLDASVTPGSDVDMDGLPDGLESRFSADAADADTDDDGLLDGAEAFRYRTRADSADTDGDTLPDDFEVVLLGTDARDMDTDRDFFLDSAEFAAGTDPLDPRSPGPGMATVRVTVLVLDAPGGSPVEGAVVGIFDEAAGITYCGGPTDASGRFECGVGLEPGLFVEALARKDGIGLNVTYFTVVDQGGGMMLVVLPLTL